jgi:hypothetical protein
MDLSGTHCENVKCTGLAQGRVLTHLTYVMLNLRLLLPNSLI